MNIDTIQITRIFSKKISGPNDGSYTIYWIQDEERDVVINNTVYENVSNAVFFLNPDFSWEIQKKESASLSAGRHIEPSYIQKFTHQRNSYLEYPGNSQN